MLLFDENRPVIYFAGNRGGYLNKSWQFICLNYLGEDYSEDYRTYNLGMFL